ncbi:hypothetical protein RCL_jg1195.t1 [Rhizophagus clarus]|uniref:Uncharacterized protein n=1 Tax=Rhizophagus clarus TaxID=94130 RepID=A0A8H3LB83_9GLOM|nr:hypothetical protein RCL_jg1195.t1 [Rhizophagus clarus]
MSTILDDDNLNYLNLNINLNELNTPNDIENNSLILVQKKVGKKKDKVWEYFNVIDIPNDSYKNTVSLRCPKVTNNIKIEYLYAILLSKNSNSAQSTTSTNYKKDDNN